MFHVNGKISVFNNFCLPCSFIHVGQVLNGIASCVVLTAPPYLSNLWFPPDERITATGIATLFNFMGKLIFCVILIKFLSFLEAYGLTYLNNEITSGLISFG